MKKLLFVVISLMLLGLPNAQARNGATAFDNKYWSEQEFVNAYNVSTAPMYRDYIVGLDTASIGDTSPSINPNNNLGQYITEFSSTTDSIYVFGVADETIPAGQLGRICIRGPHKVVLATNSTQNAWGTGNPVAVGKLVSQCANNVPLVGNIVTAGASNAVNGGVGCEYTTATGTVAASLGYIMSSTATTDTGDVGQSTNLQNQGTSTNNEYWVWISPQIQR